MLDKEIGRSRLCSGLTRVTSWRCTLTDSKLHKQPRIEQPTIYYEITFVLLTYAYALVNWANHGAAGNTTSEAKLNQVDFLGTKADDKGSRLPMQSGWNISLRL